MAERYNHRSALGGTLLGFAVFLVFLLGGAGMAAYTKYQIIQNTALRDDLELARRDNIWIYAQALEVWKDNNDLRMLLHEPSPPEPYPPTSNPADEPHP